MERTEDTDSPSEMNSPFAELSRELFDGRDETAYSHVS